MTIEELQIIEFQQLFLVILATIIFGLVCIKRRDLRPWLYGYSSMCLGVIFTRLKLINEIFDTIGTAFLGLASYLIFLAVLLDYRATFKKDKETQKIPDQMFTVFLLFSLIAFSIEFSMIFVIFISGSMLFRIFLKKKSPTYICFLIIQLVSLLSIMFSLLENFNIIGAYEFGEGIDHILFTTFLLTSVVAFAEDLILKSEKKFRRAYNRTNLFKDIFIHDVSNLLQSILSSLELMDYYRKEMKELDIEEMMDNIRQQIKKGSLLTSNVKKLSDLEIKEGKLEIIDLSENLNAAIRLIKNRFKNQNITITLERDQAEYHVKADQNLPLMLYNLLVNSIEHNTRATKKIWIIISEKKKQDKDFIKIEIIDNGMGVPDELKEIILLSSNKIDTNFSRMGLGLYLVREIIKKYHGELEIENRIKSDHSHGSNFILFIPRR
ncbi:MAG: putative Signal transduction histidine kinase [Promethearchaeota archaeon]|nr:MAG: putative Signal transduction histidine kinase [Candidatus Lokiarchaeota archaeon]